ncbi:hypothetical protein ACFLSX_00075 [Calditrichota bacterium]
MFALQLRNIFILVVLISIVHLSRIGNSQTLSNYLILKSSSKFHIYNKYEQKLTFADSLLIIPNSPFQIVNEDTFLSDDFTPCFVVNLENRYFFIIKEKTHQPVNTFRPTDLIYLHNVNVLEDTIQLISNGYTLYSPWDREDKTTLPKQAKLKRIFQKNSRTYVKSLESQIMYGWVELKEKTNWKIFTHQSKSELSAITDVESIIKSHIIDVNAILDKLFNHFNKTNNTDLEAPYWHIEKQQNNYYCKLFNKPKDREFTDSTNLLIGKLQSDLAKLNYRVERQETGIIICLN